MPEVVPSRGGLLLLAAATPKAQQRSLASPPSSHTQTKQDALADAEPSPFFEPLVRSFVLGLGFGALCESAHVAFKVSERR